MMLFKMLKMAAVPALLCGAVLFPSCSNTGPSRESPDDTGGEDPVNLYPAPGAQNAYPDGELMIVFDLFPPNLVKGQFIYIYEDGKADPVDAIRISDASDKGETLEFAGRNDPLYVAGQLTRVEGNSLFITPHHGKLEYGKTYYINIPAEAIIDSYFDEKVFNGMSGREWSFTTRAAPVGLSAARPITVDGSHSSANNADFRTVWGALAYVREAPAGDYTINVAPGVYNGIFNYNGPAANNITINGAGTEKYGADVVLQGINYNDLNSGTHNRPAFYLSGPNNIVLKNITFKNLDNHVGGQAEALHFGNGAGKFRVVYNCGFYGHQDTILTSGRVWFYQCYIEGDTDYIWGSSDAALFEECEIVSINHSVGYIFASRVNYIDADKKASKGYVIFNSSVTSRVNNPYFGRTQSDGTRYDQAAIINAVVHGNFNPLLWNVSTTVGILDDGEHAGYKVYNLTKPDGSPYDVSKKANRTSVMTDDLYEREYNGRYAILNRVYVPDTGEYQFAARVWDISAYEQEFNAPKDESLNNDY